MTHTWSIEETQYDTHMEYTVCINYIDKSEFEFVDKSDRLQGVGVKEGHKEPPVFFQALNLWPCGCSFTTTPCTY